MTSDKELMQMALDALELVTDLTNHDDEVYAAIEALRARLAQPESEQMPTKLMGPNLEGVLNAAGFYKQREWQGLTDEEREEATGWSVEHIEAKLKEKNT